MVGRKKDDHYYFYHLTGYFFVEEMRW